MITDIVKNDEARTYLIIEPLCCFVSEQKVSCVKPAKYQVWTESENLDNYTEACAEHLELTLDDSVRFTIFRIAAND